MSTTSPSRPRYGEGETLRAADLGDGRAHESAALRRHARDVHGGGVLAGLGLAVRAGALEVGAGLAVDDGGRTLVVPAPRLLSWDDRWPDDVEVRLRAGGGRDGRPRAVIRIAPAGTAGILLGRLTRTADGFVVVAGPPDGAHVRGDRVVAVSGTAELRLGDEPPGDRVAAVLVPANGPERLRVDGHGTTLAGSLVAAGLGAPRVTLPAGAPPSSGPSAWRLRRADPVDDQGRMVARELRLEVRHPGTSGHPSQHRLGVLDEDGPLLGVDAEGRVTMRGPLTPRGAVTRGPLGVDPGDPEFVTTVAGQWLGGIAAGTSALDAFFAGGPLDPDALTLGVESTGTPMAGQPFDFRVRLTATEPVTAIHIEVQLVLGTQVLGPTTLGDDLALEAGGTREVAGQVAVPTAAGVLVVVAVAVGRTAPGGSAFITGQRSWPVIPVIP